jgi:hypothetical protein
MKESTRTPSNISPVASYRMYVHGHKGQNNRTHADKALPVLGKGANLTSSPAMAAFSPPFPPACLTLPPGRDSAAALRPDIPACPDYPRTTAAIFVSNVSERIGISTV